MYSAVFVHADCHRARLSSVLDPNVLFGIASCQFALHYSFQTEARARGLICNITERLEPGGVFVGTIPDCDELIKRVKAKNAIAFGNSQYHIKFKTDPRPLLEGSAESKAQEFGIEYEFGLKDAIDDCAEYLVPFATLERLLGECGLKLEFRHNLREFYHKFTGTYPPPKGMTPEDWETAGVYLAFRFRKAPDAPKPTTTQSMKFSQPVPVKKFVVCASEFESGSKVP